MATEIFVSYSHADGAYLEDDSLLGHLQGLKRDGARFWTDKEIPVGVDWHTAIMAAIDRADIAMVLVSQAFLSSDYVQNHEIRSLLALARERALFIFPIILSPCDWKQEPWLRQRQFIPTNGQTIEEHFAEPPGVRKRMFQAITDALRARVAGIEETKRQPASTAAAMESFSMSVNTINALYPQIESVVSGQPEQQRDHSVIVEGHGNRIIRRQRGAVTTLTPVDLEQLSDRQLRHILIFQKELVKSYAQWEKLYKRYRTERPAITEQTRTALRDVVADMKDSLDRVIRFLEDAHLDVEDHYAVFRHVISEEAKLAYGTPQAT